MSIQSDARTIYEYLTTQFLPNNPRGTITYTQLQQATGVEIGVEGGYMGQVLGAVSEGCASHRLPPLTAIVVGAGTSMPGKGYFTELALLQQKGNPGGWRIDQGIDRWLPGRAPAGFDKDTARWGYQPMIDSHQESVWGNQAWPESL
jgi:hypothetical protein